MPIVSQSIKNFVAGISQQPPVLRHPEQLEKQINGFSSEASGLQKRPPTQHMFSLDDTVVSNTTKPMVHDINRDAHEKYIAMFTGNTIDVYDVMTGEKKNVTFEAEEDKQYIKSAEPRKMLKCVTIADHTFVLNTGVYTAMSKDRSSAVWGTQGALVNIKSGQYGRTYSIVINGNQIASFTTPDGSDKTHITQIATDHISSVLASQCGSSGYAVDSGSSWIYISKGNGGQKQFSYTKYPSRTPSGQNDYVQAHIRAFPDNCRTATAEVGANFFRIRVKADFVGGLLLWETAEWKNLVSECQDDCWIVEQKDYYTWLFTQTSRVVTTTVNLNASPINTCQVFDGYNNQAMTSTMKSTQKFTNLPASAPNGFVTEIIGEKNSGADNYYVRYDADAGLWKETVRPNIETTFDATTMPHLLVRERDGNFVFKKAEWTARNSGDDNSNPVPSFIEYPINDVFFYRNRLGFLADEAVIMSCTADFFNFWTASATEVQDTDPIDRSVSSNFVATLYHAVPFSGECFLFAQDTQFSLNANGALSPQSAMLDTKTSFRCSATVKPVGAGRNIYFPVERSEYTSISEYFTAQDNTGEKDAQDISTHVPNYIYNTVYKLISSTVEHMLLVLSEGAVDTIYVYKYLFINGQQQQASWSKWTFNGEVVGANFIDSYLYIIIARDGKYYVERMSFANETTEYTNEPYRILLDRKVSYTIPDDCYNSITETTTINVMKPYNLTTLPKGTKYGLVTTDGVYMQTEVENIVLNGDYRGHEVFIGECYMFDVILSQLMLKEQDTSGMTRAVTNGRLQLQTISIEYAESGYFEVLIRNNAKKTAYSYVHTTHKIGDPLGNIVFADGEFKIPLQTHNTNCAIEICSDSPQPVSLIGAKWQGNYNTRIVKQL